MEFALTLSAREQIPGDDPDREAGATTTHAAIAVSLGDDDRGVNRS